MLFFGLICGTLPALIKTSEESDPKKSWTPFVIALAIAYLVFCILEKAGISQVDISFWSYIICGIVWGLSMIIPGLSSSSLLIYMGLYEPMTAGIASLDFAVIIPLIIGLIITVILFARIVNSLFEKHYALVSRIILGIVIASSLKIVPNNFENITVLVISLICFAIGFAIARYMDILSNKQNNKE